MPQLPNPGQENEVGIARDSQVMQILDRLVGTLSRDCGFPYQPTQYLCNLKIQEMRSVERLATRGDTLVNLPASRRLE